MSTHSSTNTSANNSVTSTPQSEIPENYLARLCFAVKRLNSEREYTKHESWRILVKFLAQVSFGCVFIGVIIQLITGVIDTLVNMKPTTTLNYWIRLSLNLILLTIQLFLEMNNIFKMCLESFKNQASQITVVERQAKKWVKPWVLAIIYICLPVVSMFLGGFQWWDGFLYVGLGLAALIGCLYFVCNYVFKIQLQIGKEDIEFETATQVFVEQVATPQNPDKNFSLDEPIQF